MMEKTPNGYAYAGCTIQDLDRALFCLWSAGCNIQICKLLTPEEYGELLEAQSIVKKLFLSAKQKLIENGIDP